MKRHSFSWSACLLALITLTLLIGSQVVEAQVPHMSCFKPWMVPDRWDDANANGIHDPGEYYQAVLRTTLLVFLNPRKAVFRETDKMLKL